MRTLLAIAALAACVCSCEPGPATTQIVTEVDGCKLYQVKRGGTYPVYFTNCKGGASYQEPAGKVTRPVQVPTDSQQ